MNLVVNGHPHEHGGTGRLPELLKEIHIEPAQVAVMVNDRIIPKAEREAVRLVDGDRVEIMTFVGGG